MEALRAALAAGFEQYGKIRTDANLDNVRKSPQFKPLIDQYDEPVISESAIKYAQPLARFHSSCAAVLCGTAHLCMKPKARATCACC